MTLVWGYSQCVRIIGRCEGTLPNELLYDEESACAPVKQSVLPSNVAEIATLDSREAEDVGRKALLRHRICLLVFKHCPDEDHDAIQHFGSCFRRPEEQTAGLWEIRGRPRGDRFAEDLRALRAAMDRVQDKDEEGL